MTAVTVCSNQIIFCTVSNKNNQVTSDVPLAPSFSSTIWEAVSQNIGMMMYGRCKNTGLIFWLTPI
jgi:hypothetical protein